MKNLTKAIYGKLSGSSLADLIGNRLFKGMAPHSTEYPYAVYQIVSNTPEKTFTEDLERTQIQFSLFSADAGTTEAEDMFTALKALYDECSMVVSGSNWFHWMKRLNATLQPEDHTTASGTIQVWAYHVDYEILTENS